MEGWTVEGQREGSGGWRLEFQPQVIPDSSNSSGIFLARLLSWVLFALSWVCQQVS